MITPDQLAHRSDRLTIASRCFDCGTHRTSLSPVKPTVRPQSQAVRDGVTVFEAKTLQQNFWVTIWNIIPVLVRIKEKVGWVENKDSAVTDGKRGHQVQFVDENGVLVVGAIAIRIFMNRDAIFSPEVVWRWRRDAVVDRP